MSEIKMNEVKMNEVKMNEVKIESPDIVLKACYTAACYHGFQKRKDGKTPYINHPVEVAWILSGEGGVRDKDILAAALLHDTIEDTAMTLELLTSEFNSQIASYVAEVTDDKLLSHDERKAAQIQKASALSLGPRLIKIADKIANVKALTKDCPLGWDLERKKTYIQWTQKVIAKIRNTHPVLEALFDKTVDEVGKNLDS